MKININFDGGSVEATGSTHTELWEELAALEEAFTETTCGKCGGSHIRHIVRENDDGDKFYEVHCQNMKCRAKLRMSQRKKGGNLYPRRKAVANDSSGLEEGAWLPNGGWMRWDKEKNKEV